MANKYIELLASPRFQQLAIAAILAGLKIYQDTGDLRNAILTAVIALLTASVTVGTIDKFSEAKMASATNTTVSMPNAVTGVTASTKKKK